LSLSVIESEVGSVDSDDITESVDDWEVLESLGIDDNGGVVMLGLLIKSWVNDLEGADVSFAVDFVWEVSIDDDTINVAWFRGYKGDFAQFGILVLVGGSGWGARSLRG
jgi:hypothetical protein